MKQMEVVTLTSTLIPLIWTGNMHGFNIIQSIYDIALDKVYGVDKTGKCSSCLAHAVHPDVIQLIESPPFMI